MEKGQGNKLQDCYTKVLVVEDDFVDQMAFKRSVKSNNWPFDYTIANSVTDAIGKLEEDSFEVVISDYFLGDGTAFDLFDHVNGTPIILITGAGDEEVAVKAMKMGAYDYLSKDPEHKYLKMLPITIDNVFKRKKWEEERIQKERLKGVLELAGSTCHELNQPMTIISGFTEVLLRTITPENDSKLNNKLKIIIEQIERMTSITLKLQKITTYETTDYLNGKMIDLDKAAGS